MASVSTQKVSEPRLIRDLLYLGQLVMGGSDVPMMQT